MNRFAIACVCAVLLFFVVGGVVTASSSASAQEPLIDPLDRAMPYAAGFFECNGTWQEQHGVYWLASANVFRFRRHYTAKWYFEKLPLADLAGDVFVLKLEFPVYSSSIESGGKPAATTVDIIVENPNSEQTYQILNVRVEMNREETPIPSYVYVPRGLLSEDGRTVVELHGIGQIGVSQQRMQLLFPYEAD